MDLQATMPDDSKERLGDGEELGENKETMDEDKGRTDESERFGENKEKVEENKAKIGESKEIMVENEERIGENMEKTGENKVSVVENMEKSGEKKVIVAEHIEKTGENKAIVAENKVILVESKEKMGENNRSLGENKEKTGEKKGMKEQRMEEEDGDETMMVAESMVVSGEVDNGVEVVALGRAERESKLGVVVGLGIVHEPNDCATDDVSNRLNGQATIASSDFAQLQPHSSSTQHLDSKTISVYDDSDVESGEIRSETENVDVEMMESYGMDSTSSDSSSETSSSSDSEEDTEVEKKPTHQLERIATVQSSQATNEVDNESENEDEGSKHSNWHENELQLPFVPPIEEKLEPHHVTVPVGVISSVFGSSVVVEAIEGQQPLNEGSILWLTDQRSPLGYIDEIFGPVKKPFYVVRHNDPSDLPVEAKVGTSASYVPDFATFVLNVPSLYKKGYDASGENDQELSEAEVEFSDDEREAEYKRLAKSQSKRGYADSKEREEEEEGRGRRGGNPRWQRRGFEKNQRDHEDTRFASSHIPKQNQVPLSSPYPNSSNSKQEPIRAHSLHLPPRNFRHNGAPSPKENATMPKQSFPFRHGSHCNTEDPCNKEKPMQNTQLPSPSSSPSESHHMDRNIPLASSYENSPVYVDCRSSGIQYQHQIRSEELNHSPRKQQGMMPNPSQQQYEHQIRSEEQKQSPRQQGVMPNPLQQQYQHQIRSEEQKQSPRQQGVMPNPSHQQYQHQIRSEEQKQSPRQQGVVPNPSQQHQHQIRSEEKHHTPRQQGVMSNLSQQFHQHQIRGEESNHTHLCQQGVMPNPSQQQYQHQIWSEQPNHTHPRQQGVMQNPLQQQYQHQIRSEERNRTPSHPHAQSRFGMAPNNPNMNHPQMGVVGDVAQGFPIPFPNQSYHSSIAQPNNVVGTVIGVPAGPISSYPSNFMQGPYQGGGHVMYMQPPPPQALNMNIAHPYQEAVRQPKLADPEEFPSGNFRP